MPQLNIPATYAGLVTAFCDVADAYFRAGRLAEASRLLGGSVELIEQVANGDVHEHDQARLALAQGFILVERAFYSNTGFDRALETGQRARNLADLANSSKLAAMSARSRWRRQATSPVVSLPPAGDWRLQRLGSKPSQQVRQVIDWHSPLYSAISPV
ncbi:MAG: hypothetical protein ACLQUY_22490 [Ktedonobacterales bacterium]